MWTQGATLKLKKFGEEAPSSTVLHLRFSYLLGGISGVVKNSGGNG